MDIHVFVFNRGMPSYQEIVRGVTDSLLLLTVKATKPGIQHTFGFDTGEYVHVVSDPTVVINTETWRGLFHLYLLDTLKVSDGIRFEFSFFNEDIDALKGEEDPVYVGGYGFYGVVQYHPMSGQVIIQMYTSDELEEDRRSWDTTLSDAEFGQLRVFRSGSIYGVIER